MLGALLPPPHPPSKDVTTNVTTRCITFCFCLVLFWKLPAMTSATQPLHIVNVPWSRPVSVVALARLL